MGISRIIIISRRDRFFMKQPKKPTYEQKKRMNKKGLDWHEWMVESQTETGLYIVHKDTGERRQLELAH